MPTLMSAGVDAGRGYRTEPSYLNAFRETWLALKTFFQYRPFKIRHDGKITNLDSLLFREYQSNG